MSKIVNHNPEINADCREACWWPSVSKKAPSNGLSERMESCSEPLLRSQVLEPAAFNRSVRHLQRNRAWEIDTDALLSVARGPNGEVQYGFNELLERNWEAIGLGADYSYAVAKLLTSEDHHTVAARLKQLRGELERLGWSGFYQIAGKTGENNSADDIPCVVMVNKKERLIEVAFHGSRNGSPLPLGSPWLEWLAGYFGHDVDEWKKTDWASNYDYDLVPANEGPIHLKGAPEGVMVHRGWANNFCSVQDELLARVRLEAQKLLAEDPTKPVDLLVTGHSKGASMTNIASAVIAGDLKDLGDKVRVSGVAFSCPPAFNDAGVRWMHEVMKQRNFLVLNVDGDPSVTFLSGDYRPAGVQLLDKVENVHERSKAFHKDRETQPGAVEAIANLHYGDNRDGGHCFVPQLLPAYRELHHLLPARV